MRITVCLFVLCILFSVDLKAKSGKESPPDETTTQAKSTQQYTMDVRIISKRKGDIPVINIPKMTIQEGEKKSISDIYKISFSTNAKSNGASTPIKREYTEGTTLEATIFRKDNDEAILDVSLEMAGHAAKNNDTDGEISWCTGKLQVIKRVTLNKKLVASFRDSDLEIVIKAVPN